MQERLQKIISSAGIMSRRAAEEAIKKGEITVNGITASLGFSADAQHDDIRYKGRPVKKAQNHVYIILNKPAGYVTTMNDEQGRRSITELVSGTGVRVYPVGRLDMYSEGLILLTNDGETANALMHPSHNMKKTYAVSVSGDDTEAKLPLLTDSIAIDGRMTAPAEVKCIEIMPPKARLEITIAEGRNRQIRRLCKHAGLKVERLIRVSEGPLCLGGLKMGQWRYLTYEEISALKHALEEAQN